MFAIFQYSVAQEDEMVKVDMKSGYCHVEMHKAVRTFLGIEWEGTFYKFIVLFFDNCAVSLHKGDKSPCKVSPREGNSSSTLP